MRILQSVILGLIWIALPAAIRASPAATSDHRVSAPFQLPVQLGREQVTPDDHRPSWKRLSDGLVRRILRRPKSERRQDVCFKPGWGGAIKPSGPPSGLVARYTGDVVLRFNISSITEAEALAEAINVLFLDVWEARDEWVDLRMSKDVVCHRDCARTVTPHGLTMSHLTPRCHHSSDCFHAHYNMLIPHLCTISLRQSSTRIPRPLSTGPLPPSHPHYRPASRPPSAPFLRPHRQPDHLRESPITSSSAIINLSL